MENFQEIDGSQLEGGGQILRIALSMSALNKIPIRITNIRAGRSKSGLLEQHLKGVELIRDLSNANVKGASLRSTTIEFIPNTLQGGHFRALIKTAGSITLLLQVALPCCLFSESSTELEIHGGTNTEMAPQMEYTTNVFKPNLEKFGATFDFKLLNKGYFPKGGGRVLVNVKPVEMLKPITILEQGKVTSIRGYSFVAGTLPFKMAIEMADAAKDSLSTCTKNKINIETYKEDGNIAPNNGACIILIAETSTGCIIGSSALVRAREQACNAGLRAAKSLLHSINEGACFDEYCQDQIIILMALASGTSKVRVGSITSHTKTAIHVIEKLDKSIKFNVTYDGSSNIIECSKVGNDS